MSTLLQAMEDAGGLLVIPICLALGIVGLILGGRRSNGEKTEEGWVQQERRLENEEDTRDQGPI